MKIINRKDYINKLIALKNKPDIKIITGVRRAGKSVLLNEFSKYILSVEQNANIIRINFNLLFLDDLKFFLFILRWGLNGKSYNCRRDEKIRFTNN